MKKALYGLFVVLGLAFGFAIGAVNASAHDLNTKKTGDLIERFIC